MEKPGQRVAYPEVIDRPEIKTSLRRYGEAIITLVMWGVWIVWIWPFIEAVLGIAGCPVPIFSGYAGMVQAEVGGALLIVLKSITLIFVSYLAWVIYNRIMMLKRKGERRQRTMTCDQKALLEHLGVDTYRLRKTRNSIYLNVLLVDQKLVLPLSGKADVSVA